MIRPLIFLQSKAKPLFQLLKILPLFCCANIYCQQIDELIVTGERSVSGNGGDMDALLDYLSSFPSYSDLQQQDIDYADMKEEYCDIQADEAKAECEMDTLTETKIAVQHCTKLLYLPEVDIELRGGSQTRGGEIRVGLTSGAELYNACIQSANVSKEASLSVCNYNYLVSSNSCMIQN